MRHRTRVLTSLRLPAWSIVLLVGLVGIAGCSSTTKTESVASPSPVTAATTVETTTTTPAPTTVAGPKPLPATLVQPDTYRIDTFAVPFDITTQGTWTRYQSRKEVLALGRGTNSDTEFLVTSGLVPGSTAREVIDNVCAGQIEFAEPSTVTLLGQPAIQQEGSGKDCQWAALDTVTQLVIFKGHTMRLVAADVDGAILLIVADAPSADWPTLAPEIDAMIASMTVVR